MFIREDIVLNTQLSSFEFFLLLFYCCCWLFCYAFLVGAKVVELTCLLLSFLFVCLFVYCETHKTVNTRNIYGMLLCCISFSKYKTPQTGDANTSRWNAASNISPIGACTWKIALKYKVKQSQNGKFTSNYKASPIYFETQTSLISPTKRVFEKFKPRGSFSEFYCSQ